MTNPGQAVDIVPNYDTLVLLQVIINGIDTSKLVCGAIYTHGDLDCGEAISSSGNVTTCCNNGYYPISTSGSLYSQVYSPSGAYPDSSPASNHEWYIDNRLNGQIYNKITGEHELRLVFSNEAEGKYIWESSPILLQGFGNQKTDISNVPTIGWLNTPLPAQKLTGLGCSSWIFNPPYTTQYNNLSNDYNYAEVDGLEGLELIIRAELKKISDTTTVYCSPYSEFNPGVVNRFFWQYRQYIKVNTPTGLILYQYCTTTDFCDFRGDGRAYSASIDIPIFGVLGIDANKAIKTEGLDSFTRWYIYEK